MSSSRTPTKSGGSKKDEPNNPRSSVSQSGTPPVSSAQRRSVAGSQVGSPAVRSGAASAASPSGNRQKINSADKQNAASPLPGIFRLYFCRQIRTFSFIVSGVKSATSRTEVAENAHCKEIFHNLKCSSDFYF